jgi:hypothetical protein
MRDFTIQTYRKLLIALQKRGFEFLQYKDFQKNNVSQKRIVLRNDVDDIKENSLQFAKIQHKMGIVGTYYFRIVAQSFDEKVIKEIAGLGHEIGYHYETMDTCNGNVDIAYNEFCRNLEIFRKIVPVETVCMHGSPLSKYDNGAIWIKYDYQELGIIAEPYFDIDYDNILYLTETGRRWDGASVNIRDKMVGVRRQATGEETNDSRRKMEKGRKGNHIPNTLYRKPFLRFHSTFDIIKAAKESQLPDKIMMTFHPQRWSDKPVPWIKELMWQNAKNVGKYFLVKMGTFKSKKYETSYME